MMLGGQARGFFVYIGRDFYGRARLRIEIGVGVRPDCAEGEIMWRWWRAWSSASLPRFVCDGWRPIGFRGFGRVRLWGNYR